MENGKTPIDEKFLGNGDLFGIVYNQGIVGCEVVGWEQNKFSPYSQFNPVGSDESTGFSRLEHESDDILHIERRKKKVYHLAIGHSPAFFRRYTNYPEGENRLRKIENVSSPKAGDDFGYIDGDDSPFEHPTDAEELFIPPGVHLDFNFYNPSNRESRPVLNIKFREYSVRPLDIDDKQDMNALSRIVSPGSPMPVVPAGAINRQIDFELQEHWKTRPLSRKRIKNNGGK